MDSARETAQGGTGVIGTCAICGRPLTQVGPKGECLRCLARLGFVGENDQTENSARSRGRINRSFAALIGSAGRGYTRESSILAFLGSVAHSTKSSSPTLPDSRFLSQPPRSLPISVRFK